MLLLSGVFYLERESKEVVTIFVLTCESFIADRILVCVDWGHIGIVVHIAVLHSPTETTGE